MVKRLPLAARVAGFIALSFVVASARGSSAGPSPADRELTVQQEQEDFDLMRRALQEAHAGIYRYSTRAQMDANFDRQRAKLTRPMSEARFFELTAQTLASIRCGHTHMAPDENTEAAMHKAAKFPFQVLLEGRHVVVPLNDTPNDHTIRPGMEIVEINSQPTARIVDRLWATIPADGDIETGRRHELSGKFADLYWLLIDRHDEFVVKAMDPSGKTVEAKLPGVTDADRKANRKNPVNSEITAGIGKILGWPKSNVATRFLTEPQIAEVRIGLFMGDDYPQSIEQTFKTLHDRGTQSLILDLRGNGGGRDEYGAMLVSYFTDKPFRYFDRIHLSTINPSFAAHSDWNADRIRDSHVIDKLTPDPAGGYLVTARLHPGVAEQQPGKYPFLGKVFVLTDGGTFSTAADACAIIRHLGRATFIGEETGGGYYGNNSGLDTTLTLPHSGLRITIPMYEYWNAVQGDPGARRGTIPDHV
ncbi:MAG TPA: S41 family peptidase, partial [Tepidisphaeraceae bacterium]|nr:S41 family peptidase [Tepidisphaeraceae bacterium]